MNEQEILDKTAGKIVDVKKQGNLYIAESAATKRNKRKPWGLGAAAITLLAGSTALEAIADDNVDSDIPIYCRNQYIALLKFLTILPHPISSYI